MRVEVVLAGDCLFESSSSRIFSRFFSIVSSVSGFLVLFFGWGRVEYYIVAL